MDKIDVELSPRLLVMVRRFCSKIDRTIGVELVANYISMGEFERTAYLKAAKIHAEPVIIDNAYTNSSVVCKFRAVVGVAPIVGLYDTKEEAINAAEAFIADL
ncbi:hypothetical protein DTO96_100002 [Ephemeroptericola cinctiostellae]|uniref:Uncharacterized protein n=1 Tax=Ephemeroptericola cinctiostellae TaxID=2268024 RepID=A0A345D7H0_9BURK|nr:hypothetical protein [Ephemeroptericola cinctiostellae]AXF84308.1 hypothetical protein DTO96_100002 [Ephemeroptericola cinctiostellae]